jgi:hypothetical protein
MGEQMTASANGQQSLLYLVSVHKVPLTSLRLPENYSFTSSKLRIFGLHKPCKWNFLNRHIAY